MSETFTHKKPKKKRFQGLSINRMIPNMLTLLALSAGLTAIRFALDEKWEHAALAIVAAGILDALDGRIARLLKGASKFGAELDSLSDFVCFGVAPPWVAGVCLLALAAMMVSTVPTYSFKNLKISRQWILPTMLITGGVAVSLINAPWISLSLIGCAYIATIPFSFRAHQALVKADTGRKTNP